MSTIATTNLKHPSSATNNLTLASTGAVAINGTMTGAGLDLITTQSFNAVSSVSVNNCFSATYSHYRLMLDYVASVQGTTNMRLRTSGTDNTTGNYAVRGGDVGAFTTVSTNGTSYEIGSNATGGNLFVSDVMNPYAALYCQGTWTHFRAAFGVVATWRGGAMGFEATTSFDGFTIYPASGTITGTVSVYGYKK